MNRQWKGGIPASMCLNCGQEFRSYDVRRGGGKYCSKECGYEAKRGQIVFIICENCGDVATKREYEVMGTPGRSGFFCSRECAIAHRANFASPLAGRKFTDEHRAKIRASLPRGRNHYNWKGGITPDCRRERNSVEFKEWSAAVLKRDKYTCQYCGEVGGKLHAHHVLSFAQYPTLRYYIENGITLCKACHNKHHPGNYASLSSRGAGLTFLPEPYPEEGGRGKEKQTWL